MGYMRVDKRAADQLRPLNVEFDGLNRVDGSARFGFGETKALASVSGPIEVRLAAEQASQATFDVIVRPLSGIAGTESKSLSSSIRSLLTPSLLLSHNPRTLIQLVVQSLTPLATSTRAFQNPSLTASLINASTLALLNASSFPMRGIVCAVGIGRLHSSSELLLDPSDDEIALLDGTGTFAFLFASSTSSNGVIGAELVWSNWFAAPFGEDEVVKASGMAQRGAEEVWQKMRDAVSLPLLTQDHTMPKAFASAKGATKTENLDDKMEIA